MKRNDALREAMKKSIALWRESGKSQKVWCKEEGISLSKFKYWMQQLGESSKNRKRILKRNQEQFIPLTVGNSRSAFEEFPHPRVVNISYPSGLKISCPMSIEKELLKTLLNHN